MSKTLKDNRFDSAKQRFLIGYCTLRDINLSRKSIVLFTANGKRFFWKVYNGNKDIITLLAHS